LLIAVASVHSQTMVTAEDLHLRVTKILLKKDLRVFADELAQTKGNGVDSLLLRLDVFERAGQKERIRQTLVQLSETSYMPPISERDWIFKIVRQKISHDLAAQRIYYDRIVADDGYYNTNPFIGLWESEGDEKELEAWLSIRARVVNSSWFTINLERRLKLDNAQSILDELAVRVRLDPSDTRAFHDYLSAVKHAQDYTGQTRPGAFDNETNWMADVFSPQGSLENYDFGSSVDQVNPSLAIKYYLESLAKTVTAGEIQLLEQKYRIHSNGAIRSIDWQKQMRYWTKERLAAAYQRTAQAPLAQPLIEELIANKSDDIFSQEIYGLAGAVQSGSGARAVESKVVQDEATRAGSVEYWVERISYYEGRGASEQIVQTFRNALANLKSFNKAWFAQRVGYSCRYHLRVKDGFEQLKPRISEILINEFNKVWPDADIAFKIVSAASEDGCELKEFNKAVFILRRDVLGPLFEKRAEWSGEEQNILEAVLKDKKLSVEQRSFYFAELEKIVSRGSPERRLALAGVFIELEEHARRIPLILSYLKQASGRSKNEDNRRSALWYLFDAYLDTGNWQAGEKLILENQPAFLQYWGNYLERLAICAGRQNASNDALRIWLKAVNFNGHSTGGLMSLADTPAKPLLREYYLQMKQREPTSPIPDAALKMLR
jgi:hypothetical protein